MPIERALQVARDLGIPLTIEDQPPQAKALNLLDTISASVLKTAENPLIAFRSEGRIVSVQPDLQPAITLSPTERAEFEGKIGEARAMAEAASRHAGTLQSELDGKQQEIRELTDQMQRANDNLRDLQIALGNAQRDIEALRGPTPPSPEGEGEGPESGEPRRRRPR
jgi:chromosome segregation ATPase